MAPQEKKARGSKAKARQDIQDSRRVLQTIKEVKDGTYRVTKSGRGGKCLIRRTLRYSGYKLLLEEELAKPKNLELLDFFNSDKFRFDYTHRPYKDEKQFVIHLPSVFHAAMTECLRTVLVQWLQNIEIGNLCRKESMKSETMRVAGEISSSLSTKVQGDKSRYEQVQPDLSFTYKESVVPDLVVDVVWSESDLNLHSRAGHYMESEDGPVQTIVGLDMADIYDDARHAKFSIWTAKRELHEWVWANVVPPTEFIDENGQPVQDCRLILSIYDFIGRKKAGKCKDFETVTLALSASQLHIFYQVAFRKQLMANVTEKMKQIKQDANESLEDIIGLEQIIQEQETGNASQRTAIGEKEVADAIGAMSQMEDEIGQMRIMMQGVGNMIDKANNGLKRMTAKAEEEMDKVEKARGELESTVAELETKLAKARAAIQSIVGVDRLATSSNN